MKEIKPMDKIPYKSRVSIRLDEDTMQMLRRICKQADNSTNSHVISHLIHEYYWMHCVDQDGNEHDLRSKR